MKITLCGSIAFYEEMESAKSALESLGHEVQLPPSHVENERGERIPVQEFYRMRKTTTADTGWVWERKQGLMSSYFDTIAWADAILVVNQKKNGIDGYIGANTFLEMGIALSMKKRIFVLHALPDQEYIREELLGMQPIVLEGNFGRVN